MADPIQPVPPRFWWLKRLSIAGVLALLVLVGLRWYWGHEVSRRLDSAIADIRARGEPVFLAELAPPPVEDHENAAALLRRALATWPTVDGQLVTESDWYGEPDEHPDPIADSSAYLRECETVLALLRQADEAPGCDWRIQLVSPAISIFLPHLGEMRQLARLVDDAAQRAHALGDDALALRLIGDLFVIADAVEEPPSSVITHLVAISIRAMAAERIERFAQVLSFQPHAAGGTDTGEVDRLVERLLDPAADRDAYADGMIGERAMMFDNTMAVVDGRLAMGAIGPVVQFLVEPLLRRDALRVLDWHTIDIEAMRTTSFYGGHVQQIAATTPYAEVLQEEWWRCPMSSIFLAALDDATRTHYQALAKRRMAGVAIAIRRYELDHGRRPAALAELVPAYLDAVPLDPFAADGRVIAYRVDAPVLRQHPLDSEFAPHEPLTMERTAAVLYCVGRDGDDDGGRVFLTKEGDIADRERYTEEGDLWFLLDPAPEPEKTGHNSQGTEDDADVGDRPGD